jgi:hypothetical protein
MCIRDEQPFYYRKNDPNMYMDLYFTSSENAGRFADRVAEFNRYGNKVEFSRSPEHVIMPHAGMDLVYWADYTSVDLDDAKRMQMFEKYGVSNPRIRSYACRIAPVYKYEEHAKDINNIVYVSWLFLKYFYGYNVVPTSTPQFLIRAVKSYERELMELSGQIVTRHRIDVVMDFLTIDGCTEIRSGFHDGYEMESTTRVRTHIYCVDAERMCYFLALRHAETADMWGKHGITAPPLFAVEHGCARVGSRSIASQDSISASSIDID